MTIKLEAGKKYKTRDREVIECVVGVIGCNLLLWWAGSSLKRL